MYSLALGSPGKAIQNAWEDRVMARSWFCAAACGAAGRQSQKPQLQKQVGGGLPSIL